MRQVLWRTDFTIPGDTGIGEKCVDLNFLAT